MSEKPILLDVETILRDMNRSRMACTARGIYFILLAQAFRQGGSAALTPEALASYGIIPKEWKRSQAKVLALGTVVHDRFVPRLEHAGWGE